ncbi:ATP-binding protein [Chitiniphilus purpureus]|uniref:histidine kinase n=1 Tax=Chitiniphilus purpureus TaxID=2981137 RepID=A0ABY6DSE4_9NEIS|nr:ATP-binding protein [Chitiniphilus sp. CD1]
MARERRFTADAAHELRTPLAALRIQLEVASQSPRPDARRKALLQALAGCERAAHLVSQLLKLARLDQARPALARIDLAALVHAAAQGIAPPACVALTGPWQVAGHAGLLEILLRNLLDNARRYGGPGATVTLRREGDALLVEDNGPGVPPALLARLDERFFRVHPEDSQGVGLGLSIVRRVAQLHGAALSWSNRAEGGFAIRLALPATGQTHGTD